MSQEQDEIRDVREAAMRCLTRREYSSQELFTVLRAKGHRLSVVNQVLTEFQEQGLQSDNRFAEMYIRSRAAKGCGPQRIEMELRQRGVVDGVISQALNECEIDWLQVLYALKKKKFGSKLPANTTEKAKQWRFLQYKGFSSEMIKQVLQENQFESA